MSHQHLQRLQSVKAQLRGSKLLRNIITAVSGTAGAQLINLALIPVIMRIYGPEVFGVLGTFQSLTIILIPVAALTYPMAIVLPRSGRDARTLIRVSLLIAAAITGVLAVLLYGWGRQLAGALGIGLLEPYLMLLPLVMFSAATLEITQQWLYRNQRFGLTARAATIQALCYNAVRSLAGLIQASAPVLVATTALQQTVHTLLLLLGIRLGRYAEPSDASAAPPESARTLAWRYRDFPLFRAPQMLINAFSHHVPTLVLAASFGAVPAGFFALCVQVLSIPTNFIGRSVGSVYYPRITEAIHDGESVSPLLAKGIGGLALIGVVPFMLVAVAGPVLFGWVFGEEWRMAGEFARWLAIAEFIGFIAGPCVAAAPALSMQRQFFFYEIACTSLRVIAVAVGAFVIGDARTLVMGFAATNAAVNVWLIVMVLLEAKRAPARSKREVLV
jgi:O-antigen/teichoic acid export membrane protein